MAINEQHGIHLATEVFAELTENEEQQGESPHNVDDSSLHPLFHGNSTPRASTNDVISTTASDLDHSLSQIHISSSTAPAHYELDRFYDYCQDPKIIGDDNITEREEETVSASSIVDAPTSLAYSGENYVHVSRAQVAPSYTYGTQNNSALQSPPFEAVSEYPFPSSRRHQQSYSSNQSTKSSRSRARHQGQRHHSNTDYRSYFNTSSQSRIDRSINHTSTNHDAYQGHRPFGGQSSNQRIQEYGNETPRATSLPHRANLDDPYSTAALPSPLADAQFDEMAERQLSSYLVTQTDNTPTYTTNSNFSTNLYSPRGMQEGYSQYSFGDLHEQSSSDTGYKLHPSRDFWPGRVLKCAWAEPRGSDHNPYERGTSLFSTKRDDVFVKDRRFIIIWAYVGHCVCVPIMTYGNQACKKIGVKPLHHGIVHSTGTDAQRLPGEPPLGFAPIMMQPSDETERLRRDSRVNYAKWYTIEHNMKVRFVGEIIPDHLDVILRAVGTASQSSILRPGHS